MHNIILRDYRIEVEILVNKVTKVTIDTISETIKELPKDEQEIILYLADIFQGVEETINEYVKNEFINE